MTEPTAPVAEETLYCANHPQVATRLRCNKCGKLICTKCAVRTPVGYRCRECVRGQQAIFETALWYDYLIASVICLPVGALSAAILGRMGFFMFFLAPVAGGLTAELVRAAVRRRRGRYLTLVAAAAFLLGALGSTVLPLVGILVLAGLQGQSLGGAGVSLLGALLFPLIYAAISASTLYARLRGISI
jgi:MFS family permease